MNDREIRWFSISIYLEDGGEYSFMNDLLRKELRSMQIAGGIRNYYFNVSENRGSNFALFIEGSDDPAVLSRFDGLMNEYLEVICPDPVVDRPMGGNGNSLFLDVAPKQILYNMAKLRAEPFLYCRSSVRDAYFDVLHGISRYVMQLSREDFVLLMDNRLSFCYNLILFLFSKIGREGLDWSGITKSIANRELSEARVKLDRDPEASLLKAFNSHREVLYACFKTICIESSMEGYSYLNELSSYWAPDSTVELNGYLDSDDGRRDGETLFYSLIQDIYAVVNLEQKLACTYFINQVFHLKGPYAYRSD